MINRVGDYFASAYAIDSEQVGADNLELILENVPNIVALTKAEKYLSSLPPVTDVQLMKVSKQQAQFYLNLSGEGLDVVRALALLPEFEKITDVEQKQPLKSLTIEQQLEILTREYLAQTQQAQQLNNSEGAENAVVEDVKKKSITLKYKWLGK
jgi:aryl carrier-like protein